MVIFYHTIFYQDVLLFCDIYVRKEVQEDVLLPLTFKPLSIVCMYVCMYVRTYTFL